jgi:hypothetical protein
MKLGEIVKNERIDCGFVYHISEEKSRYYAIPVKAGLKIECDEEVLNNIKQEECIKNNFLLNIKELDENYFSVYFADKM